MLMTKNELIEVLSKIDNNGDVFIASEGGVVFHRIADVSIDEDGDTILTLEED